MSHCLLIYLSSCARNLDTEQAFARSPGSCVIYNHVSSFIKKSVSGAGASAEHAAFHPLCAKQGSLSPGEACTEGSGVSGSASECQASKRTSPEDIRAWWRRSADLLRLPFISLFLFSFRTHSQSFTCRLKEIYIFLIFCIFISFKHLHPHQVLLSWMTTCRTPDIIFLDIMLSPYEPWCSQDTCHYNSV